MYIIKNFCSLSCAAAPAITKTKRYQTRGCATKEHDKSEKKNNFSILPIFSKLPDLSTSTSIL
jgi:hypothetical protein